ncbi:hypothetical protein ACFQU7_04375 [Pseudoroseomonas wenyumeiae]
MLPRANSCQGFMMDSFYRAPGNPLVLGYTQRIGPGRFRVVVEPPLPLLNSGDMAADIRSLMLAVNGRIAA